MILEDLLDRLEDIEVSDTYLYFITRVLKHNQKKNSKVLDKYLFKVNAARKSKVDDNTARMQSIKQLGV